MKNRASYIYIYLFIFRHCGALVCFDVAEMNVNYNFLGSYFNLPCDMMLHQPQSRMRTKSADPALALP